MQADLKKQGLPPAVLLRLLHAQRVPDTADRKRYERTPWFRELTERAREAYGHRCKMCGRHSNHLLAHHVSYRRLFREDIHHDITLVCPRCHQRIHRK